MKNTCTSLVVIATLFLNIPRIVAQENVLWPRLPSNFSLGVEIGANYNIYTTDMVWEMEIPRTPMAAYTSGDGFSPYATMSLDYKVNSDFGVILGLSFDQKRFGNSEQGIADCRLFRPGGSYSIVQVDLLLDYDVTVNYLGTFLAGRANITPDLFVTLGPFAHFRIDSTRQSENHTILSDGPCEFLDTNGAGLGKEQQNVTFIQSEPSSRYGLAVKLGYRIPIDRGLELVPTLGFQYFLTEMLVDRASTDTFRSQSVGVSNVALRNSFLHSAQLGLAVNFDL